MQDGESAVRLTRLYPRPRPAIWHALTDVELLSTWFDPMVDYGGSRLDFTEGANLLFVAKDNHLFPALAGRVARADRPRSLTYTFGPQKLLWKLTPIGNGSCRLGLTVVADLRGIVVDDAPRWQAALDALHATLTGRRLTGLRPTNWTSA